MLALLVFAAGLCAFKAYTSQVLARDSFHLLRSASHWADGAPRAALAGHYAPLYPLCVGALLRLGLAPATAALAVSAAAAALCVLPAFFLAWRRLGGRAALAAALCVACSPVLTQYAGEALTEALFFLCLLSCVALALDCQRSGGFLRGAGATFAAALAGLTRPEGLAQLVFVGLCAVCARRGRRGALLGVAAVVLTGIGLSLLAGEAPWQRKNRVLLGALAELTQGGERVPAIEEYYARQAREVAAGAPAHRDVPDAVLWGIVRDHPGLLLRKLSGGFLGACARMVRLIHPLLGALAGLGLVVVLRRRRRARWLLLPVLLHLLAVSVARGSARYVAPTVLLWACFAGLGLAEVDRRWLRRWRYGRLCALLLAGALLLPQLRPERRHRVWVRSAGEWIARNLPAGAVYASDSRVAGYAGGTAIPRPTADFPHSPAQLFEVLEAWEAVAAVFPSWRCGAVERAALEDPRLEVVATVPDARGEIFIARFHP